MFHLQSASLTFKIYPNIALIGNIQLASSEEESRKKKRSLNITPFVILGLFLVTIVQGISIIKLSNIDVPEPPVYSQSTDGSITELIAVGYTSKTGVTLANFAAMTATYCLSLSYTDYDVVLDECADLYFSAVGMEQFKRALNRSGIGDDLRGQNLIQSAVLAGVPTVVDPGRARNKAAYVVDVPINIIQNKASGTYKLKGVATITVSTSQANKSLDQYRAVRFDFSYNN